MTGPVCRSALALHTRSSARTRAQIDDPNRSSPAAQNALPTLSDERRTGVLARFGCVPPSPASADIVGERWQHEGLPNLAHDDVCVLLDPRC
jgi:hypothetical protein